MTETKKDIIKRTLPLLIDRGLKTSMDEIAQYLSVSKRTIYENFENKDELIYHCVLQMIDESDDLNEYIKKSCNPIEELFPIVHENIRKIFGSRFKLLAELQRMYPKIHENCLIQHTEEFYNRLKDIIQRGKKDGLFRKDIEEDIIIYYMPIISSALSEQKAPVLGSYSMKDIFSSIMIPLMRGMLTEKGIDVFEKVITKFNKYSPGLH